MITLHYGGNRDSGAAYNNLIVLENSVVGDKGINSDNEGCFIADNSFYNVATHLVSSNGTLPQVADPGVNNLTLTSNPFASVPTHLYSTWEPDSSVSGIGGRIATQSGNVAYGKVPFYDYVGAWEPLPTEPIPDSEPVIGTPSCELVVGDTQVNQRRAVGDTAALLVVGLTYYDGGVGDFVPVDLTSCTVEFSLLNAATSATKVSQTSTGVTIVDAANGIVSYQFSGSGVDEAGIFYARFHTNCGGSLATYPVIRSALRILIDGTTQSAEAAYLEDLIGEIDGVASPAMLLRASLITAGIIGTAGHAYPSYTGSLPAGIDDAVVLYDTASLQDGRLATGASINHPGVQIKVRTQSYTAGVNLCGSLQDHIDQIANEVIQWDALTYTIRAASRQGDFLSLGLQPDNPGDQVYWQFTLNIVMTVT